MSAAIAEQLLNFSSLRSSVVALCFTGFKQCAMISHVSSLKQFIRESPEVRSRFAELFPKPEFISRTLLVPCPVKYSPQQASLVGTAFDYLLRFYAHHLNLPIANARRWVAEAAVNSLEEDATESQGFHFHEQCAKDAVKARQLLADAKQHFSNYLAIGNMSDALFRSVLNLATLDPIMRAGTGEEMIGLINERDTQDLKRLIQAVDESRFKAKSLCLLNPIFCESPDFVIGADADLVLDDVIIDIKTTELCRLNRSDLDQLIGYFLLNEIVGFTTVTAKPLVSKVGIYFSRHAYFYIIPIRQLINDRNLADLLTWFKDRLIEYSPQDLDWTPPRNIS